MVAETAPDWLVRYASRGFKFVFYPSGHKHPIGLEGKEWTTRHYDLNDYKQGDNVGVLLGQEVQPGRFLTDIDFDWGEGVSQFARKFFPDTGFGFGRTSKPLSHAFYTTSQPIITERYEDIDGQTLVEIRGTKSDGSLGMQTMVPPSKHPSGEDLILHVDDDLAHDDHVPRAAVLYAITCLLYRHLGKQGFTHDVRLATAGFLLGEGLTEQEVVKIGNNLLVATENKDVHDVAMTVKTTLERMRSIKPVSGRGALMQLFGADGKKIVSRIRRWAGNSEFTADEKDRVHRDSQVNIRIALDKLKVRLHFDTFQQKYFVSYNGYKGLLSEELRRELWLDIDRKFNFRPTPDFFWTVVLHAADQKKRHPVVEYLEKHTWDGTPRLAQWLIKYAGAQLRSDEHEAYVRAVSTIVMVAAVRRVRKPGCKFDELLILESGQGTFKSSALRALCPNEDWFTDDLPLGVDAKQVIERTSGKWIIEASELHGIRRSEAEHLKSFLSRQVDGPVRLAYERTATEVARQFIVVGTTNSMTSYLKDPTGNRRFWPVAISKFDIDKIIANRDQLWAEAAYLEAQDMSIRLPEELHDAAGQEQDRRRLVDTWEESLTDIIDPGLMRVPVKLIWDALGKTADRMDNRDALRIAAIMESFGFIRKVKRRMAKGENAQWVWERPGADLLADEEDGKL